VCEHTVITTLVNSIKQSLYLLHFFLGYLSAGTKHYKAFVSGRGHVERKLGKGRVRRRCGSGETKTE
jgi:hypothetical protein